MRFEKTELNSIGDMCSSRLRNTHPLYVGPACQWNKYLFSSFSLHISSPVSLFSSCCRCSLPDAGISVARDVWRRPAQVWVVQDSVRCGRPHGTALRQFARSLRDAVSAWGPDISERGSMKGDWEKLLPGPLYLRGRGEILRNWEKNWGKGIRKWIWWSSFFCI